MIRVLHGTGYLCKMQVQGSDQFCYSPQLQINGGNTGHCLQVHGNHLG